MAKSLRFSVRGYHTASKPQLVVGIRREDPKRIWERRAPLVPDDVHRLISRKHVAVHIEPCDRRVIPEKEYVKAGAVVTDHLEEAHIVIGIKETPIDKLLTSPIRRPDPTNVHSPWVPGPRIHMMFSHTAKGQPYNTPLLSHFVSDQGNSGRHTPQLIDYELLTDEKGKRTVGFGWHAGVAGALETLSSAAHAHLESGIASPFLYTPRPHSLPSLGLHRESLRNIGKWIEVDGTPRALGPFVIGVTGTGNVAEGCLSILSELPLETVDVGNLESLVRNPNADLRKIYLVHAKPVDYLVRLDGKAYDRTHYYQLPSSYVSKFCEKVAPYLTVFLNGVGWSQSFPRLMTNEQLVIALERAKPLGGARFTNIGDISCDIEGGLQFLTRSTTISEPFYKASPSNFPSHLPLVQIMSVDILPASIPLDASKHFSSSLLPYIENLIDTTTSGISNGNVKALERATISEDGVLASSHAWLLPSVCEYRNKQQVSSTQGCTVSQSVDSSRRSRLATKRKILILGSGMVAAPAVDTLSQRSDVEILIASDSLQQLQNLARKDPNIQYRMIDLEQADTYEYLITGAHVVISLLPAKFHPRVARMCIQKQKHLVTASYTSPEMTALHDPAMNADVLLLNEIGLDPGLDHCSAVDLISRLRTEKKQIKSFISFCGGLPAPEVPVTPLRYKFSWSPVGVLLAVLNDAQYRLNNVVHQVPFNALLDHNFSSLPITNEFAMEGVPNRDSLPYAKLYGIPDLRTVLRGTLRYPGYARLLQAFKNLGLLENGQKVTIDSWESFVTQAFIAKYRCKDVLSKAFLIPQVSFINVVVDASQVDEVLQALDYLCLLPQTSLSSRQLPMPALPAFPMTPLETFALVLSHRLAYEPGERDMVILVHEIVTGSLTNPVAPEEVHLSSLVAYGTPTASAMARTVGIPVALAALGIVDERICVRGTQGPWHPEIYRVILDGLQGNGLGFMESKRTTGMSVESHLTDLVRRKVN